MAELYDKSYLKAMDDFFQAIYAHIEKSAQEGKLGAELGIEDFSKLLITTGASNEDFAERLKTINNNLDNNREIGSNNYDELVRQPLEELKKEISELYSGELHDDRYSAGDKNATFTVRFGTEPYSRLDDNVKKILSLAEWNYIKSANNMLEDYRYNKDTGEKLADSLADKLSDSPARKYESFFG